MNIFNIRQGPQNEKDQSLCTFDVMDGECCYLEIRLMKSKHGHLYLSYPYRKRMIEGKQYFLRLYCFGKEKNKQFEEKIMKELKILNLLDSFS
jgi:hypothetical protein